MGRTTREVNNAIGEWRCTMATQFSVVVEKPVRHIVAGELTDLPLSTFFPLV